MYVVTCFKYFCYYMRNNHMQLQNVCGCCTYICPNFSPYLARSLGVFMLIVDEKRVKLTSFESYCIYNVFCLTFRRNFQVLIERMTSGAISGKEQRSDNSPKNQRKQHKRSQGYAPCSTAVLQGQGPRTVRHLPLVRAIS